MSHHNSISQTGQFANIHAFLKETKLDETVRKAVEDGRPGALRFVADQYAKKTGLKIDPAALRNFQQYPGAVSLALKAPELGRFLPTYSENQLLRLKGEVVKLPTDIVGIPGTIPPYRWAIKVDSFIFRGNRNTDKQSLVYIRNPSDTLKAGETVSLRGTLHEHMMFPSGPGLKIQLATIDVIKDQITPFQPTPVAP